ncbi:hypothetical protein BST81_16875 [Leptolyngbya sp. 'hensonii']|uniref:hypothetical protein n=1 Tax=Leptolyngbya sp. 'hensonii' TaxID=1922337 RepID=UPI00094FDB1D|nr:hypothetical protein [Leptolyngbya sp. 'hensonii']OLP17463.1 hypothetical protein BST81_16875 [Leptolyngbya sp. 'hensonii']
MSDRKEEFRTVNQLLGARPRLGPLAAEQVGPWLVILGGSIAVGRLLQFDLRWTLIIAAWGIVTWWILTGSKPWRFLSKFQRPPTWGRGYITYQSLRQRQLSRRHPSRKRRP